MVIIITSKCSLECPHCMFSCTKHGNHMTKEVLEASLEFFKCSNSSYLQISGGEPTEHPKFLPYLLNILNKTKGDITLLSNGQFLFNKAFTKELSRIHRKYKFTIQITSIANLYPNHERTVNIFKERSRLFKSNRIYLAEKLSIIDNEGRAKGKDFSFLGNLYKRQAPSCFNLFSLAKANTIEGNSSTGRKTYKINSLISIMEFLDYNTKFNRCKPIIGPFGDIYPGECFSCPSPGNTLNITCDEFFEFLKNNIPCMKCFSK